MSEQDSIRASAPALERCCPRISHAGFTAFFLKIQMQGHLNKLRSTEGVLNDDQPAACGGRVACGWWEHPMNAGVSYAWQARVA
jgi:hypothetical protein